jgi:hypothetical protein
MRSTVWLGLLFRVNDLKPHERPSPFGRWLVPSPALGTVVRQEIESEESGVRVRVVRVVLRMRTLGHVSRNAVNDRLPSTSRVSGIAVGDIEVGTTIVLRDELNLSVGVISKRMPRGSFGDVAR